MTVGEALERHYSLHGLPADGGAHATWFRVRLGPVSIPLPNPPARRRAVFLHDVNHLLTGYDTVFSDGELSIAAFEVGTGCGRVWVAWFINLFLMAIGTLLRPRAVVRAFIRGRRSDSIYRRRDSREFWRDRSVDDVRAALRVDSDDSPRTAREYVAFVQWSAIAWLVIAGTGALVVGAILAVVGAARAIGR
jgi:hypothetical protein